MFVFGSIDVVYYIYGFAYIKPSMYSWSESHLDGMYNLLDDLLHSISQYLIENLHQSSLVRLAYSSPFYLGLSPVWVSQ